MKKFLLLIALIISGLGLNAQSVGSSSIVYYDGYSLKFTVTKLDPAECKVVCDTKPTTPGAVSIPSSVTIEGSTFSVTSIGNSAFSYCSGLTSIEIPNSVTSIGNSAFFDCSGLTSIEIPNSVTSIGEIAFYSCSSLERIVVENGNTVYDSRNNCNAIIETQTNTLLYGCMNTIIPNSVTSIGNDAFSYCYGLTSIEIPNSVTSIGNRVFYSCKGLTSIEIPNSVTSIGESAFLWCSHLRSIKCHAVDVPVTATNAFNNCPEDMTIQVPEESVALYQAAEPWKNYNVTEIHLYQIGDYVVVDYEGYSLRYTIIKLEPAECEVICETKPTTKVSITIPSSVEIEGVECSVTKIGNDAFKYCSTLSIEIPNSVTSIGNYAFFNCSGLTSIEIPNSVTSIGNSAFSNCFLTSIEIPNSVTSIGNSAFYYCNGLTSIEIPSSVTSIGNEAFSSCSNLESIVVESGNTVYDSRNNCNAIIETSTNTLHSGCKNTIIPNSVTSIGDRAFYNCDYLTSIEIPNSVTSIGERAFYSCSSLERIVVENGNTVYDSRDNCNAIIETQTNTLLYGCMNTIIPNSVTSIGNEAFYNCDYLTSIEIPNSVTSIGNYAFYSCSGLTSIEIPNSVTSIGRSAFIYCSKLTSIEISNSVTSIKDYAFAYCFGLTSIEIPNSVTSIGENAFISCSGLTSIEIPNSVTSIGNNAFSYCSNLTSVKCHAENVPTTKITAFNNCPEDMTIQVPEESVALYQVAEPWKNYNIVAGFNSTINLTSNIEEGGFVEGSGNYQDGTEITVYAYVNPNYGFLYWSEDEEIVSYSPEYTFTVSNDRNLTANFAINHWIPDYTIYPNTMAVVGVVQIDGIEQNSSNIEIGAFCGNELRGSNRLFYESKYDRYYLYLTIYGKDDDEISFKIYDHTIESELKLYYNETINFSINDNIGSSAIPMIFNFTTEFLHKRQLSSNWNWYSTFVAVEGRNGFVMLTEGLGELGIQVKSQFAFSNYETGDWSGGLNTVSTGNMYMIKMSEPIELGMSGIIVEPSEFPIVLSRNWKWIPYPVSVPMDVTTAFAEFTPHDGDIVKSQEGFTQYYEGLGWSGSLNTMTPGEGYMYQNTSGEEKTLYYPTTGEAKGETKTNITSENNYWKPEVSKYPTNMSVIAVVDHSDEYDFEVAAFSNGECRGSARPIYIDGLDKNILFLTIYGEDNETITFRYYDANSGEEYNISNRIIYSTDSTIGNVKEPYVINLIPANVNEITENEVCIYPNPVNTNSEIHLTTECDRVEVYNSLGVKISEHENVDRIDGIEVSGVYIIKVVKEGVIKYNRIVVK